MAVPIGSAGENPNEALVRSLGHYATYNNNYNNYVFVVNILHRGLS